MRGGCFDGGRSDGTCNTHTIPHSHDCVSTYEALIWWAVGNGNFFQFLELTHEFELVRWLDDQQLFGHFALICVFPFLALVLARVTLSEVASVLFAFPAGPGPDLLRVPSPRETASIWVLLRGPSAGLKTFLFRTDR